MCFSKSTLDCWYRSWSWEVVEEKEVLGGRGYLYERMSVVNETAM